MEEKSYYLFVIVLEETNGFLMVSGTEEVH